MASVQLSDLSKATQRLVEIFSVKGLKAFDALKAYWQPAYEGRRLNRKIEHLLSPANESGLAAITKLLVQRFAQSKPGQTGLTENYVQELAFLIVSMHAGTVDRIRYDALLEASRQLQADQLDDFAWRSLQFITTANGLFPIGLICRERTTERIVSVPIDHLSSRESIHRYFNAAMDDSRYDLAALALARFKSLFPRDIVIVDRMTLHFHLMQGHREETLAIAQSYYSESDREFAKYIQGKRVAIVGPAPSDESVAQEIDSFDVVIRTNYRGRDSMPPAGEFGRKIDVSYYNYTYTKQVLGAKDNAYLDDLSFAVFKNEIDIRRYQGRPTPAKFRIMRQINEQILNGKSQMVQNIIYDLLHFEPKEIKIFKSNFFMSEKRYYSTYASPTNQAQKASSFWMNFATHDLVTQLKFSQTLLLAQQISGDHQASEVMQLDSAEYMKKISQIYAI